MKTKINGDMSEGRELLIQMDERVEKPAPKPSLARMCFAELIGTMVVILFGNGCVAQAVLSKNVSQHALFRTMAL